MRKCFAVSIIVVLTTILTGCPFMKMPDVPSALYFAHVDNGGSGSLLAGGTITVLIPAPGGTGYFWEVISATTNIPNVLFTDIEYRTNVLDPGIGAPGYYVFTFKAVEEGTTTIQLGQFSPVANPETDTPEATWSADVTVVGTTEGMSVIGLSAADNNETRYLPVGAGMRVELLDTPLGNNVWTLTQDGAPVITYNAARSSVTSSDSANYGGLEFATFWFDATTVGTADIELAYGVPGEVPLQTFTVSVIVIE